MRWFDDGGGLTFIHFVQLSMNSFVCLFVVWPKGKLFGIAGCHSFFEKNWCWNEIHFFPAFWFERVNSRWNEMVIGLFFSFSLSLSWLIPSTCEQFINISFYWPDWTEQIFFFCFVLFRQSGGQQLLDDY